ncbi:MAG: DUF3352 domain-containing protein [Bacteroidales bacterium]|nr:DUF3352 domain-containing protein [Bacteroidales bacterium]
MMKWIRISVVLIFLIGIVVGGIYYYQNSFIEKEVMVSDIYKYIPTDAALIIEAKNISNLNTALNHSSKPWSLLKNIKEIERLNQQINYFDSVVKYHPLFKYNSTKGPVLLSFHPSGKKDFNTLLIVNFGSNTSEATAQSVVQDLYGHPITINEKTYNDQVIFSVIANPNDVISSFHFCFIHGLFIASNSSLMVEEVLRQHQSQYSLFDNPSFKKVVKTAGQNVEANLFINHKLFNKLWKKWLSSDLQKANINTSLAEWSAFDLHVSQNMFLINGFIDHGDSLVNYLKILSSQESVDFSFDNIIPKESHTFLFLSMSHFKNWQEAYSIFLESYGLRKGRDQTLSLLKKNQQIDIIRLFDQLIYKEVGLVFASNPESSDSLQSDDTFFIINTDNQTSSKEMLDSVLENYAQAKGKKYNDYILNLKLDNELSSEIYSFPITNIPEILFGSAFSNAGSRYAAFIDNYLIFTKSKRALQRILYANTLKKTLKNEELYRSYTDMLDKESNLLFYCDIARAKTFLKTTLHTNIFRVLEQNFEIVRQMDAVSCQISNNNDLLYTSLYVRYSPEIKQNTHTVWESKLDTTISMKPYFVINHTNQEKEIWVQDDANNIYLINNSGRILWKNHLPEKIKSDIFQVDLMKNKRLQYLFSTKNYIYIVDRNGEVLENYPIKLKAPATNAMSLITINKKNEQRIWIACADKKVYCYTLAGKLDKTWTFETTNHFVYQPVQYVSFDNKEYIYFVDTLNIYILNQQGKPAINIKQHFPINRNAQLYFEPKNHETETRFVINDIEGNIHFIYLDGKVKSCSFDKFSPHHYFLYNDMDADGYSDFIFVDEDELLIYQRNKKIMLSYSLPSKPLYKPIFYEFPLSKNKIGLVCKNSILLVDKDGKMPSGFPLKGISPFSISIFSTTIKNYYLIVGSDNGYLLNYEVFTNKQ